MQCPNVVEHITKIRHYLRYYPEARSVAVATCHRKTSGRGYKMKIGITDTAMICTVFLGKYQFRILFYLRMCVYFTFFFHFL